MRKQTDHQTPFLSALKRSGFTAFVIAAALAAGCSALQPTVQQTDLLALAEGYIVLQEPEIARSYYKMLLQKNPSDSTALLGLAKIALEEKNYHAALRELNAAEQGYFLTAKQKQNIQILLGETFQAMNKPPAIVWSYLYPVWQDGDLSTKSFLDERLKDLARKLPGDIPGVKDVLGFIPPPPSPSPPPRPAPFTPIPRRSPSFPAPQQTILTRTRWNPAFRPDLHNMKRMGHPTRITVHHSYRPSVHTRQPFNFSASLIRGIQRYHVEANNWSDIGYHFLIDPNGRIWTGRSLKFQGAHASGIHNRRNIGICVIGNCEVYRPTPEQVSSLTWLVKYLQGQYSITKDQIFGHCHFKATKCPGKYLMPVVRNLRRGA